MPRKKKEEVTPAVENAVEAVPAEAVAEEAPAEKPKRGRRKRQMPKLLMLLPQRRLSVSPVQRRLQKRLLLRQLWRKSRRLSPESLVRKLSFRTS